MGPVVFLVSDDEKIYDNAYYDHKDVWQLGFATEIAQGLMDDAKEKGAEKVTIFVNQTNEASRRFAKNVAEK